jgi:hypothetical protein
MPLRTMLGILAWLSMAVPCAAHHSFVVEYDVNRPLKLKGVVTKVEWSNPHARLSVAVVDANGATTTWHFELASPNVLERNGWTRWTLNVGDRISVEGYGGFAMPARGTVRSITTPDGRTLVPGEGQGVRDSRAIVQSRHVWSDPLPEWRSTHHAIRRQVRLLGLVRRMK